MRKRIFPSVDRNKKKVFQREECLHIRARAILCCASVCFEEEVLTLLISWSKLQVNEQFLLLPELTYKKGQILVNLALMRQRAARSRFGSRLDGFRENPT